MFFSQHTAPNSFSAAHRWTKQTDKIVYICKSISILCYAVHMENIATGLTINIPFDIVASLKYTPSVLKYLLFLDFLKEVSVQ